MIGRITITNENRAPDSALATTSAIFIINDHQEASIMLRLSAYHPALGYQAPA